MDSGSQIVIGHVQVKGRADSAGKGNSTLLPLLCGKYRNKREPPDQDRGIRRNILRQSLLLLFDDVVWAIGNLSSAIVSWIIAQVLVWAGPYRGRGVQWSSIRTLLFLLSEESNINISNLIYFLAVWLFFHLLFFSRFVWRQEKASKNNPTLSFQGLSFQQRAIAPAALGNTQMIWIITSSTGSHQSTREIADHLRLLSKYFHSCRQNK